jgi:hypothetical protein
VIDGFIVDFYCHAAGVVVEVDGEVHRGQAVYDRERDRILKQRGLRVIRVSNAEISSDLAAVLARIARACSQEPNPLAPFPAREGGTETPLPSSERGRRKRLRAPLPVSGRGWGRGST